MASSSGNGSNSNDAGQLSYDGPVSDQNPSVSTDWTPDEQAILEDGLSQYASESNSIRYAKTAVQLQNKTVMDVALRCRWMFINTDDHQEQAILNQASEKEKMKKKRSTIMAAELPSENIYHILSRLPVKSLARFQCVSKLWRNYINDPYLETLHAKRAVINDDQMLISFHNASASRFIIRFLEYKQAPGTLEAVTKKPLVIELMCNKDRYFDYVILGSCNGLLYSTRTIRGDTNLAVINPLTKECCELPPVSSTKSFREDSIGLGFDDSTNTFKMVFIERKLRTMVHVLGTDSWRKIPQVPSSFITGEGVFANGSLHWLSEDYCKTSLGKPIISFHMTKEEFGLIDPPGQIYSGMISKEQLVDLHGELGYVYQIGDRVVEVWVLKETGWVMHCLFEKKPPLSRDSVKVIGFWNERKDILMTVDGCRMFIYNLNNDSSHEISFDGLEEEGSNRIDIRMYRSSLFSTRYSLF